jgi:MFS transporter, ACS family, D-galactonate transporter
MGQVYSAYLLVYTIFMIPGGWLIDRYGTRAALGAMSVGAGICVMLTGAVGLASSPATLFVTLLMIRGATGLFSVPMFPGSARAVAAWFPAANRSLANGLVTAAALLGSAGTFYIFGALIEQFDWTGAFLVSGVVTLGFSAVWVVYARSSPAGHPAVNQAELRLIQSRSIAAKPALSAAKSTATTKATWDMPRLRSLAFLSVSYGLYGYFQYVFFFWIQYYFKDVLHLGTDTSRRYATYVNLAMAVGMFAGGWIADALSRRIGLRWGRAGLSICALLAGAAFLYCGLNTTDERWVVGWLSLSVGAVGMTEGPFWVTAIELGGRRAGAAGAIFNTIGNIGGMIGPVATPMISAQYGWRAALVVASLVCVASALLWIVVKPGENDADVEHLLGANA